jgi:hypothetical protein
MTMRYAGGGVGHCSILTPSAFPVVGPEEAEDNNEEDDDEEEADKSDGEPDLDAGEDDNDLLGFGVL